MSKTLRFYYPKPKFPSVSITGEECYLECNHCKGHYLKNMRNVNTPIKLRNFCISHEKNGGLGLLISGGSTKQGKVPLTPFLDTIRWIKDHTNLILNLHTGILNKQEASEIASTGIDVVSVDLIGSDETLKMIYGLNTSISEYSATLTHLVDCGVCISPHICIGIHYGEVRGERIAIKMAAEVKPETIIFISFIPTAGTPMADIPAPKAEIIYDLISRAVKICKDSEISLGCMRQRRYKSDLDWLAIQAGVSRLALPSRNVETLAKKAGYKIQRFDSCCAIPRDFDPVLLRV